MKGEIRFEAEVGKWICIKKEKIDEDTKPIEISRLLASIHDSLDRKIWEYLKEDIKKEQLDKIAYEITEAEYDEKKKQWKVKGKITEEKITKALAKLNSPSTSKKIEVKDKHLKELAKAYLTRKVLELLGFKIEADPKLIDKYLENQRKPNF